MTTPPLTLPRTSPLPLLAAALLLVLTPSALAQQYNLDEVCDIYIDDGRLALDVKLVNDWGPGMRFGGRGRMDFTLKDVRGDADGRYRMAYLLIKSELPHGPDRAPASLQLESRPFGLKFSYQVRGHGENYTAHYNQLDNRDNDSEGGYVTLLVQDSDSKTIADLRAESFTTLCREHPREATLYLGPVFRALRLGTVFAVEPRFARLVLADPLPPDEVRKQVVSLVKSLDHNDPKRRAAAAAEILRLGLQATSVLRELDQSLLSPQQQAEVEAILHNSCAPTEQQARRFRSDPDFLIDCLYSPDEKVRSAARDRLQHLRKKHLPVDFDADPKRLTIALERLRDELAKKD